MSAYLPHNSGVIAIILVILIGTLVGGWVLIRLHSAGIARGLAWTLVAAGALAVERLSAEEPAGVRMVAMIAVLLGSLKALVTVGAQTKGKIRLSPGRWLGFATLWLGMRPAPFAASPHPPLAGAARLLGNGLRNLAIGLALIGLARFAWLTWPVCWPQQTAVIGATGLLLLGLSFVIHFGIANLLAGGWRWAGVDCRALFRAPLQARSLGAFWGRRWNLGFAEMTSLAVYRPVACRFGSRTATLASFLFSGLMHEAAISLPVGAGFGLPLLYFSLHGLLVLIERRLEQRGMAVDGWGWLAHVWTLGWLALPLPILFHPYFLRGVVWPLIGMYPG